MKYYANLSVNVINLLHVIPLMLIFPSQIEPKRCVAPCSSQAFLISPPWSRPWVWKSHWYVCEHSCCSGRGRTWLLNTMKGWHLAHHASWPAGSLWGAGRNEAVCCPSLCYSIVPKLQIFTLSSVVSSCMLDSIPVLWGLNVFKPKHLRMKYDLFILLPNVFLTKEM